MNSPWYIALRASLINLSWFLIVGIAVSVSGAEHPKLAQIKVDAARGNAESQIELGKIYSGVGFSGMDVVEAYKWFSLACAQDFPGAKDLRNALRQKMNQTQIAEAQKRALEFVLGESRTMPLSAEAKNEDLRKLMSLTGSEEQMKAMFTEFVGQWRTALPQVSEPEFQELVKHIDHSELREIASSIFARHFAQEEIKGLVEFYQTPLGKKLLVESPTIAQETLAAGIQWGRKIGERLDNERSSREKPKAVPSDSNSRSTNNPRNLENGSAIPKRRLSEERKAAFLREQGFDPAKHGFDEDSGAIYTKEPEAKKPIATKLPPGKKIRYLIIVSHPDHTSTLFSDQEPKPFGNGYKVKNVFSDNEIIVSGNVEIIQVDKK